MGDLDEDYLDDLLAEDEPRPTTLIDHEADLQPTVAQEAREV